MRLILLAFIAVAFYECEARIATPGEVENSLRDAGADLSRIDTWQCIVNEESKYDTNAYNSQSGDHGIFQISELYWCSTSNEPGGGCNLTCASLQDDDITNDAQCAVLIYNDAQTRGGDGFQPWTTYERCR